MNSEAVITTRMLNHRRDCSEISIQPLQHKATRMTDTPKEREIMMEPTVHYGKIEINNQKHRLMLFLASNISILANPHNSQLCGFLRLIL